MVAVGVAEPVVAVGVAVPVVAVGVVVAAVGSVFDPFLVLVGALLAVAAMSNWAWPAAPAATGPHVAPRDRRMVAMGRLSRAVAVVALICSALTFLLGMASATAWAVFAMVFYAVIFGAYSVVSSGRAVSGASAAAPEDQLPELIEPASDLTELSESSGV